MGLLVYVRPMDYVGLIAHCGDRDRLWTLTLGAIFGAEGSLLVHAWDG